MVLAIVHFILGVPYVFGAIWLLMATADISRIPFGGSEIAKYLLPAAILAVGIAAGYFATAWGLWNLRNWARAAAIAIAAVVLVALVGGIASNPSGFTTIGLPALIYVAAEIAMIYYLLTPQTAAMFGGAFATTPIETTCPHCGQAGIPAGAMACPYCRRSLALAPDYGTGETDYGTANDQPAAPPRPATTRVAPPQAPVLGWLVVKAGPNAGKRLDLYEDTEIGRGQSCQIRLDDDYVSRSHARVKCEDGQFFIYDLGSSAGTFVNDRRVQRLMLYDGALIRLGQTTMEFKKIGVGR